MYYSFILYPTSLPIAYEQIFNTKLISPKGHHKTQYNFLPPTYFTNSLFCNFQYGVKHLSISTQMSIIPIVSTSNFTNSPPPRKIQHISQNAHHKYIMNRRLAMNNIHSKH